MASFRKITGTKQEILQEIERSTGRIVSVLLEEDVAASPQGTLSDAEAAAIFKEMEADTVSVPHADDSREAIYTRMPGE